MKPNYKPKDYNSASPYLIVSNTAATIAFLQESFGANLLRNFQAADGRYVHAEVRIDDSVVMLADCTEDWPAQPSNVHIYVKDVDATYAKALSAGAQSVQAPQQKDDPDKRGGVRDIGGTTWWIATQRS